VFLGCVGVLAWLERERLWTVASSVSGTDDPFARCFAERAAAIDRMQAEGTIQAAQAELFKTRAEAMCRATVTEGPATAAPLRLGQ
jgi:hypothetical protein